MRAEIFFEIKTNLCATCSQRPFGVSSAQPDFPPSSRDRAKNELDHVLRENQQKWHRQAVKTTGQYPYGN